MQKTRTRRRTRKDQIGYVLAYALVKLFRFLFDPDLILNKLGAVALLLLTLPCIILENDATATVFLAFFAVPMFFSKDPWIYL